MDKIFELLKELGENLEQTGLADMGIIYKGHDVHAFYRLRSDSSKAIHVQGYSEMSTNEYARVYARMMDYDKMMQIRDSGYVSIGNEHEATIKDFDNFGGGINIQNYDSKYLYEKLLENIIL